MATRSKNCLCCNRKRVVRRLHCERAVRSLDSIFPWSLLLLNPLYFALRLAGGIAAAVGGKGEMVRFPGFGGKLRLAWAVVTADLAALRLLPRMLAKRADVRRIAKLRPRQIRRLILDHRIPVRALVEKSN